MKRGLWHKRMPTVFAFIILIVSIWVTSFLIQKGAIFVGRATPDKVPENVKISNVTDSSFTVSFTTKGQTLSGLSVEEAGRPSFVVFDDRNKKTGGQKEFYSHYITVSDLTPNTSYNFMIISDGQNYMDGDRKYFVRTSSKITASPPQQNPIFGTAIMPDGNPAQDTIAELQVKGGQLITTLTKENGEFIIPTNSLRKLDGSSYFLIEPQETVTVTLRRQDLVSTIRVLFKDAGSLPVATLQYEYDFTSSEEAMLSTPSSQLKAPTPKIAFGEVKILTPRENESFVDNKPSFRGTALPNKPVEISILSGDIKTVVTADGNGIWSFRSQSELPPGKNKITIKTQNKFGTTTVLSQDFSVFASGSQIADAKPSIAQPSPSPTPTTPTPTQAPSITNAPSPSVEPSITPTVIPTVTLSPTETPIPSMAPSAEPTSTPRPINITPPPTGSSQSVAMVFISLIMIVGGSLLLFIL